MHKFTTFVFAALLSLFVVSKALAEDCEFCHKDHKSVCKDECQEFPEKYSKTNCSDDCINQKCQKVCEKAKPSSESTKIVSPSEAKPESKISEKQPAHK